MHKAVGWMLREAGKKDEKQLIDFLDRYTLQMPRTAVRLCYREITTRIVQKISFKKLDLYLIYASISF